MLDQLQMAIRRYEQIAPNAGAEMTLGQGDQLAEWLELQVGEITASLLARPGFRRRARWPIERLTGEFDGPERDAVLAVDDALVRCAKALSAVARRDEIWRQLLRIGLSPEKGQEGAPRSLDPQPVDCTLRPTPLDLRTVEFLAQRPWRDLASAWDYFGSSSQLNLLEPDGARWADFSFYVNKRLRVPGDFVTRCLEIRINSWQAYLQKLFVRCQTARLSAEADLGGQWTELNASRAELDSRFKTLRALCFHGREARIRDSCIALLQIHAGFHQDIDISWLGPVAKMVDRTASIPHEVRMMERWDVPERAATALVDIVDLVRRPQAPEELIEEMKATKRLVLVEEQREGYLDGMSINRDENVDWHAANLPWEFLWTLADRARGRRNVDPHCLSNRKVTKPRQPPSQQAIKDRRANLKKLIVPELNDLIVDAGPSTYRLELKPDDICLLGWFAEEQLVVLPRDAAGQ